MDNTVLRFHGIFGVPVEVQQSAALLLAMMAGFTLLRGGDLLPVLIFFGLLVLSVYLHELGHAWGARVQGVTVRRIVIHGGGGFCEHQRSTNNQDELIVAMGPIVNLALWAICGLAMEGFYSLMLSNPQALPMGFAMQLFGALALASMLNLFLFFYNMVPVQPLDGGKLLQLGLRRLMPPAQAMPLAQSQRPAPALRAAGASAPTGRALASRSLADPVLLARFHRAGKTRCVSAFRPLQ